MSERDGARGHAPRPEPTVHRGVTPRADPTCHEHDPARPRCLVLASSSTCAQAQWPVRARGGLVDAEEGRWVGVAPGRPHARTATAHRLLGCGCAGERGGGWRRAALAAVAVPLEVEEELEDAPLEAALEAALVARLPLAVDYLVRGSAERVRVRVRARVALGLGLG